MFFPFMNIKTSEHAPMAGSFYLIQYLVLTASNFIYLKKNAKIQFYSGVTPSPLLGLILSNFYNHIYSPGQE